ncbi:MAG: GNAT family N-acetyltransferase [Kordiimonas sp.]
MVDLIITEVQSPEKFWDLLLLADPSKSLIQEYLADGRLFSAVWDDVIVGVFVLLPLEDELWELKNIAVSPEWQGKGVGKALLVEAIDAARTLGAKYLEVGTGNSSVDQLAFYQKAGFRLDRIAKNYFTLNYEEPIFENGIQCRDMVFFKLTL